MTVADLKARRREKIAPEEVHDRLREHVLVDGLEFVLDLERSQGAHIYDAASGREIIDLFTCFATSPLGFNHPKLREGAFAERILSAAVNKPSNSDLYTVEMAAFVEALARTVPEPLAGHMFFIEGGALAVENALKAAFDWKSKKNEAAGKRTDELRIAHLRQAFHGRSGYTMSLTNTDPAKTDRYPKFKWPRVTNPKLSFPVTDDILEGVEAAERESIAEIKAALAEYPDQIAGLILEPIQGEGGDNHFRPEYFEALRDLANEAEFLLIFDEVQTGFGTTGKWWCFEHLGVLPDVFAFGKKTQVCGICASRRLDEVKSVFEEKSRINSTWGGNLADMVRCTSFVEIIEEENLLDNATEVGAHLLRGVQDLAAELPDLVSNPRGRGMFAAFDLPDKTTRNAVRDRMLEKNVLGLPSGDHGVRFRPPLNLTRDVADEGLGRLREALVDQRTAG